MVSYEALIQFTTNWWGWRDQDESDIGCLINRFYLAYWGACVQHRQRQIRNDVEVNGSELPRFFFSSHIRVFWHFNIGTKSATKSGKQRRRAFCADLSQGGEYILQLYCLRKNNGTESCQRFPLEMFQFQEPFILNKSLLVYEGCQRFWLLPPANEVAER